mgnify:CR=1 FL=1
MLKEENKEVASAFTNNVVASEPTKGVFLYTLKRGSGVVTLSGSMLGGSNYAEKKQMVPSLVVSMLDQGTKSKSKFEISDQLESVGARLGLGPDQQGFLLQESF